MEVAENKHREVTEGPDIGAPEEFVTQSVNGTGPPHGAVPRTNEGAQTRNGTALVTEILNRDNPISSVRTLRTTGEEKSDDLKGSTGTTGTSGPQSSQRC